MTPRTDDVPLFSLEQVEYLKRTFPERSPRKGEAFDQLRWRGGECSVVAHIEALYLAQNETTNNVQDLEDRPGRSAVRNGSNLR